MVGCHHQLSGQEFEQDPGVGDGQGSLTCCSPWGHKELDTTRVTERKLSQETWGGASKPAFLTGPLSVSTADSGLAPNSPCPRTLEMAMLPAHGPVLSSRALQCSVLMQAPSGID